jgi:UDP-glucose 4-epimerase
LFSLSLTGLDAGNALRTNNGTMAGPSGEDELVDERIILNDGKRTPDSTHKLLRYFNPDGVVGSDCTAASAHHV